jgi:glutaredoxin
MRLTIYSKPGCHLCEEMKSLLDRLIAQRPDRHEFALEEIDISGDRELLTRYALEIPVLMIDGKKVAKYRVSQEELTRMMDGRRG